MSLYIIYLYLLHLVCKNSKRIRNRNFLRGLRRRRFNWQVFLIPFCYLLDLTAVGLGLPNEKGTYLCLIIWAICLFIVMKKSTMK